MQGIARDLLTEAIKRYEARGLPVVFHWHDDVVCEVPIGAISEADFLAILLEPPPWADGLPLAGSVHSGSHYLPAPDKPAIPLTDAMIAAPPIEPALPDVPPIETPAQLPDEAPAPAPPPPRYNGFGHDNFASEILVSLRDIVGEPLAHNKVRCPFHDDATPSCHIYHDHYHCFACGAHGDAINWLMEVEGLSFTAAQDALACWEPRQRPAAELADDGKTLERARKLWDAAQPIAGTRAADYLTFRHIDVDQLPSGDMAVLRFHPDCPFGEGIQHPCLLALFQDVETDAFAGIHRVALTASAFTPGGTVERRMLGRWPGRRAIKLWPASDTLVVGEGIETVLAAATRVQERALRPAWALGSAGALARFPLLAGVRSIAILVDNDPRGRQVARDCAEQWCANGRTAMLLMPTREGDDFNDVVRRRSSCR